MAYFRIGKLEASILQELATFEENLQPEQSRPEVIHYRIYMNCWKDNGIPFIPSLWIRNAIFGVNVTASDKAKFSRSLSTLRAKNLIETRNWYSERAYITHVTLTAFGRGIVLRLHRKLTLRQTA